MAKPFVSMLWAPLCAISFLVLAEQEGEIERPEQSENQDQLERGRQIFNETASPACSICHTLADAGASGAIGPNLDELKPSVERVRSAINRGVGVMPAYSDSLSEQEMIVVSHYVTKASGSE